jgi:hypothetical protein
MTIRVTPPQAVAASGKPLASQGAPADGESEAKADGMAATLARLPPTFNADFARITIPSGRVALMLCGVAPTQLVNFPEGPGLNPGSIGA